MTTSTTTGKKTTTKWSNSSLPLNLPFQAKPNSGQMRKLIKPI